MIKINKREEPRELASYRLNKKLSPTYDDMKGAKVSQYIEGGSDKNLYDVVLSALVQEQGGICAYCMKRIPQKNIYPSMTIEHLVPQHKLSEEDKLKYQNMVAVCNGNRNSSNNNDKTCDARRAVFPADNQTLSVNPLDQATLDNITYSENGRICSVDFDKRDCLNNLLNLNHKSLVESRARALVELQQKVYKDNKNKTASKQYFDKLYKHYVKQEIKVPYVGILLYWLDKKRNNK